MKAYTIALTIVAGMFMICGCVGYSDAPLYSPDIKSVYVEMFDNTTFWRDFEYALTNALAKKIEAETPYKIVSNKSKADTIISGKITGVNNATLTLERSTGRPLEQQAQLDAVFSWKSLKTGDYILENQSASAVAAYSEFQKQSFDSATTIAANKLATRIVEQMQTEW